MNSCFVVRPSARRPFRLGLARKAMSPVVVFRVALLFAFVWAMPVAAQPPDALSTPETAAVSEVARLQAEARLRYLEELRRIHDLEIEVLRAQARGEVPATAAALSDAPIAAAPVAARPQRPSFLEQIKQGTNVFVAVWTFEIVTLAGSPLTIGKLLIGLVALILGMSVASRITRALSGRFVRPLHLDENATIAVQKAFFYIYVIFVILFTLQLLSIPLSLFTFLGGAGALALGFGAQNILNNFISGWILMIERPIRLGDLIEIDDHYGSVESIGARCTRIRLFTGIHILVPNSALLERNVINWTLSDDRVRVCVQVGVAYGSPTRQVETLIRQAVTEHEKILREPPPTILFENFGDNSLDFEVHFWVAVRRLMDARKIRSEIRYRIDDLFREAGITIAFPQRDVHLDTLSPLQVRVLHETPAEEIERQRQARCIEEEEARRRARDPKTGGVGPDAQSFRLQADEADEEADGDKGGDGTAPA